LAVRVHDNTLPLGGLKQRALMAVLILRINQVVSVESLVDALWPADPPRTAVRQVQDLVSQLRRAIGRSCEPAALAAPVIETCAGGYVLLGDPAEVDSHRFTALTAAGNADMRAGRHHAAAGNFRAALDMWRGDALMNIGLPAVRREARRLDEQRLDAREAWVDCETLAGNGSALVGQLTTWVDEHPLREAFRRQLMVALHQSGRRAEALEVYRRGRDMLIDELGIEPGAALRETHQALLGEDRPAPPRPAAGPQRVPRQLPPDMIDFTGRADQVRALCDMLASTDAGDAGHRGRAATAVVRGGAGVGKSVLAVHVAHQAGARFADGHLFADLRGSMVTAADPRDVLGAFLRDLCVPAADVPDDLAGRRALFRTLLANRRVLIVLDDAQDEAQVLSLMPAGPGCAVLITTRRRIDVGGYGSHVDLGPLPHSDALTMLCGITGAARVARERTAAMDLVRACGHLPLVIRVAGGRLASRSTWRIADLVVRLDSARCLDELSLGAMSVRESFERTYRTLDASHRRAFERLGLLDRAEFDLAAARVLLDVRADVAENLLERLVDNYLLLSRGRGKYVLPDLLKWYARECLATGERGEGPDWLPAARTHVA
jgi:DNA-binding SARP family transcriptional activator